MAIDSAVQCLLDLAGGEQSRQLEFGYSIPAPTDPPGGDRMRARMAVGLAWDNRVAMARAAAAACPTVANEALALSDAMTAALHYGHLAQLHEAHRALEVAAYQAGQVAAGGSIEWSRTLSKAEAARLHNGRKVSNPTAYFEKLIEKRLITPPRGNGQQWQFVIQEFPPNTHDNLRGKLIKTSAT